MPVPGHRIRNCATAAPRGREFSLALMLVDAGILTAEQVATAQDMAWRERQWLGRVLVRDGLVLSRDLATLTALNLGLAMVDLHSQTIDRAAVGEIPEEVARRYMVLPISKLGDRLTVAMTDPTDLQLIQDLAARTGCTIEPVITTDEDIKEHVDRAYRLSAQSLGNGDAKDPWNGYRLPFEECSAGPGYRTPTTAGASGPCFRYPH